MSVDASVVNQSNVTSSSELRLHSHSPSFGGETIVSIPDDYVPQNVEYPMEKGDASVEMSETNENKRNTSWTSFLSWLTTKRPADSDRVISETKTRSLEECPTGYSQLAAFLSSEPNFSQYRSFGYLHSRCLLDLQHDIWTLEKELDELDGQDSQTAIGQKKLQCRERDERASRKAGPDERTRRKILDDIRDKLVVYDDILIRARDLLGFQRPSDRDYRSVRAYVANEQPLSGDEDAWIKQKEDIITLRHGREWAHFDGWVESQLNKLKCFRVIKQAFTTPELRAKTKNTNIHYFSEARVQRLTTLLITAVVFILLVLPVVAMYKLTSFGAKSSTLDAVGVLIVFTLLFGAAMSLLTRASRHELFAASAAYCAVLVVFISNFGTYGNGRGS